MTITKEDIAKITEEIAQSYVGKALIATTNISSNIALEIAERLNKVSNNANRFTCSNSHGSSADVVCLQGQTKVPVITVSYAKKRGARHFSWGESYCDWTVKAVSYIVLMDDTETLEDIIDAVNKKELSRLDMAENKLNKAIAFYRTQLASNEFKDAYELREFLKYCDSEFWNIKDKLEKN